MSDFVLILGAALCLSAITILGALVAMSVVVSVTDALVKTVRWLRSVSRSEGR